MERRSNTQEWISSLVEERQRMLVMYAGLAGLEPYTEDKPVAPCLEDFCQLLVDYIAAGHFGLYERISSGRERRRATISLAEELYPRIADTTEAVVKFNDYFDTNSGLRLRQFQDLPEQLSRLGEDLATRIDLEDKLIDSLLR